MDEEELVFKRFPADKQEQVRQLVGYATLMGLSGKDLVSIGGKLDRIKAARERASNMEIINSFNCLPIGADSKRSSDDRFKLKTSNGNYNFENHYGRWKVTSLKTKATKVHQIDSYDYELPRLSWDRRSRYVVLLDISQGKLVLNF
jgi:hypothetical protein